MRYSEKFFVDLAKENPQALVDIVEKVCIGPSDLTFAAEALGAVTDSKLVEDPLLKLLNHESPLVREGAIYAAATHKFKWFKEKLKDLKELDPSPAIKEIASDYLDF